MANPLIVPLVLVSTGLVGTGTALLVQWRKRKKPVLGELPAPGPAVSGDALEEARAVILPLLGSYEHGHFHEPVAGDSISLLANRTAKAIHPGATPQQVAGLRRAIALSGYNRQIAGEPAPASYYAPEGVTVDRAFMPKHEGIEVLRAGYLPRRNIDAQGKRIGPSQRWAPLFVPRIRVDVFRSGASDPEMFVESFEPPAEFWDKAVRRQGISLQPSG